MTVKESDPLPDVTDIEACKKWFEKKLLEEKHIENFCLDTDKYIEITASIVKRHIGESIRRWLLFEK
jgi:hypothetical protein